MIRALFASLKRCFTPPSDAVRGERAAETFLRKQGYRVLARNLRSSLGEIDLLAEGGDGRTIVVVEVKTKVPGSNLEGPRPEVRVNLQKQRKLAALAMQVVKRYRLHDRPVRFDVIGVDLIEKGEPVVRHHVAAFESPW